MAMQRTREEVKNQFDDISGYRCKHCGEIFDSEDGKDPIDHLFECIEYIKIKNPPAFESLKKYDLSIQANKTYPGKLVVQNGTEDEIVKGIKEILETHSIEIHLTRLAIWNHSVPENMRS